MILNYTPIDIQKFSQKKDNQLNFYLLLIATLSAVFFAVLLFILIQKKMRPPTPTVENQINPPTPTVTKTVFNTPTPLMSPTSIIETTQPATPSPTIITPNETTPSAKIGSDSAQ